MNKHDIDLARSDVQWVVDKINHISEYDGQYNPSFLLGELEHIKERAERVENFLFDLKQVENDT